MARIAPRRQAQIANEKRSKFRELFPSLVSDLGISDEELYSFLNEEFDIPLVNYTRGRQKSKEIPVQSKDDAYDVMQTDSFREKLEDRFSTPEEPPAEELPVEEAMGRRIEEVMEDSGSAAPKVRGISKKAARKVAKKAARTAARTAKKVSRSVIDAMGRIGAGEPDIRKKDSKFLDKLDERAIEELSAEEPETDYTDEAISLFKNTHGTEFDPKSSMDRGKLEKMKGLLAKQGGLGDMSANQFALQVYRNS